MRTDQDQVVVIGAGLAGLTAAATAARQGRSVVLLEAHGPGGRARTDHRNGYLFNQGPHALYKGGPAWGVLRELGVSHRGHMPPLRGMRGLRDGGLVPLAGPGRLTRLAAKLAGAQPRRWAGRTAIEWAQSLGLAPDDAGVVRTLLMVSTYVPDLDALPADVAIAQLRTATFRGVSYIDGGWDSLVRGLLSAARHAGVTLQDHAAARAITGSPGRWEVETAGGDVVPACAVVIAGGGPAVARRLLPVDPGWGEMGPEVTAACLDLGVTGPRPRIVFGLDEPIYISPHCPPGDLAPAGGGVVHVMRYGARDAERDRAELAGLARLAGINQIAEERFLARMTVTHLLPSPRTGLAGRPPVEVAGAPGLYLAGDWVGPVGWLADAAMASGRQAGTLAARFRAAVHPVAA